MEIASKILFETAQENIYHLVVNPGSLLDRAYYIKPQFLGSISTTALFNCNSIDHMKSYTK